MVSNSITSVGAPIVAATTRGATSVEIPGIIIVGGTADSGTTIRIAVDGTLDTSFDGFYNVAQGGRWNITNIQSSLSLAGPSVSPGVHTLVASSYASDASLIPLQTSAPVKVAIGTNGADTLYGPVLGSSIEGPTSLIGYYGDDRFIAYTVANDASGYHAAGAMIRISGGYAPGMDTVVLPVSLADGVTMVLQHPADTGFIITTPDATITMINIEKMAFSDLTITVQPSVLNDFLYYDSRYRDLAVADVNAQQHYEASGWREGRDPNAFFSTTGYLASNADVATAGINPLTHYDTVGWKEGRDPSAAFDTSLYLRFNPDVAASGIDPLTHYLAIGRGEGRKASPVVDSANLTATGFDPTYYKLANPDVAQAGMDLQQHYLTIGFKEGRNPDAFFDTVAYLRANPDVAAAGANPLLHYMTEGWREGRDPSSHFDTSAYLAGNPDVAAAGINPLEHFLQSGITEGRSAHGDLF